MMMIRRGYVYKFLMLSLVFSLSTFIVLFPQIIHIFIY